MKVFWIRILRLIIGLITCAFGIAITIKANVGYASWEVFHSGLSKVFGLPMGMLTNLVGILLLFLVYKLGEKMGIGTILNILLLGTFLDIILNLMKGIQKCTSLLVGIPLVLVGFFILSIGVYLYVSAGFGAGPRDSLMLALTRITKIKVGICKIAIDILVSIVGWLLGGNIGIGTVLAAFAIGFFVQIVFDFMKFDTKKLEHETLDKTFNFFKEYYKTKKIAANEN